MAIPAAFKGQRLQRRAWTIPVMLAFAPLGLYLAYRLLPYYLSAPLAYLPYLVADLHYVLVIEQGLIPLGMCSAFALIALVSGLRFSSSAKKALASGLGLQELPDDAPLTRRVHKFAKDLGLPPPKVGVMRDANAYAIGSSPKDAAVVIGYPLLQSLNQDELDAIIGHELGHILTGDMKRMQMAAGFQSVLDSTTTIAADAGRKSARDRQTAGLILVFGQLLRWTIFLVSELMMKAQSRRREYAADAVGALVSSPASMANALRRLHGMPTQHTSLSARFACLMFFGAGGRLFATHPTVEQRLAALESGKPLDKLLRRGIHGRFGHLSQVAARVAAKVRNHPKVAAALADDILMHQVGATLALMGALYLMI